MNVIETDRLCKSYGNHRVLLDLSLQIQQGKLVGFLGPNGAGKTTTIRILMGLLASSSGHASIFGQPVGWMGKQIRREVGYLPGDVHLYSSLTGYRLLRFLARARGRDCLAEARRLANALDLDLSRTIRKFSTGMRQKLGLIQALMHRPRLLILDEPTSALDPLVRTTVFQELQNVIRDGRSVLFSSHSLDEVESLCDEVVILRAGRIVEHQKIDELKKKALRRIEIEFSSAIPGKDQCPAALKVVSQTGRTLAGTWSGATTELLNWVGQFDIDDLIVEKPDLNDLFISYYSGQEFADDNLDQGSE